MLKTALIHKLLAVAVACLILPAAQASNCEARWDYEFRYYGNEEVMVYWDVPETPAGSWVYIQGTFTYGWGYTGYAEWRQYVCDPAGYWQPV